MTLRIGVDTRPLASPMAGIGRYTKEILARLVPETAGEIEWFLYSVHPPRHSFANYNNVTERTFARSNRLLGLLRPQFTFASWAWQDKLDVFWSPRHHLPLFLPSHVATVLTIHDVVWKLYPDTMMTENRWIEQVLMPPSLRKADRIICVSESTRRDLVHHFPATAERAIVILEAAGNRLDVEPKRGQRYFLFVGTLEPRKNLSRLIESFAQACERGLEPDCKLVIAGGEGWKQDINRIIANHGVQDRVLMLGRVDDQELYAWMAGAIALCLVSLQEGFGLPALEAMTYGTPVIGSNVSSIPEVVGEGGLLVDPASTDAIATALVNMATDRQLRDALSAKALAQAGRFSWDLAARQTLELLVSVGAKRE